MKSIADYLIDKTRDLNQADLAKAVGVSQSFLSRLRSGQIKSTDISLAIDLALYFKEPLDKVLKLIGKEAYYPKLKRCLAREFHQEPAIQLNIPGGEFDGIKCYDSPVCLGPGYNMDDAQVVGYLPIHRSELPVGYKSEPDRVVCFPTAGTSMIPTILPDSHIVIDRFVPADVVQAGGIYAFLLPSGDVTIKRLLSMTEGSIIIGADNPTPGFPMALQLRDDFTIVRGRVIWVFNRLVEELKK